MDQFGLYVSSLLSDSFVLINTHGEKKHKHKFSDIFDIKFLFLNVFANTPPIPPPPQQIFSFLFILIITLLLKCNSLPH